MDEMTNRTGRRRLAAALMKSFIIENLKFYRIDADILFDAPPEIKPETTLRHELGKRPFWSRVFPCFNDPSDDSKTVHFRRHSDRLP